MKIALVNMYFSEKMGYADLCLARSLASLGHEVHLIASDLLPYAGTPLFAQSYAPWLGPGRVPVGVRACEGFVLHRLPHGRVRGRLRIRGLLQRLARLRPDIVQSISACSPATTELALARPLLGYRLFVNCHIHASVFPLARGIGSRRSLVKWTAYAQTAGRCVSAACSGCFPISEDAADIATRFFGIDPKKVEVIPLGVATDLFRPPEDSADLRDRAALRARLGFGDGDVVCIYTGRLSTAKDPLCLARAVVRLRAAGLPFRGLFIGGGEDQERAIRATPGNTVLPFMDFRQLGRYYRAADVAVWPRQESTSQLDALACGLPLVVSDQVGVPERVSGCGAMYAEGDAEDLARVLRERFLDPALRARLGAHGASMVRRRWSWRGLARRRLDRYRRALGGEAANARLRPSSRTR